MKPRKTKPSAQDIANIAGVSLTLVNRKLSQGKSPRTIIYEAELMAQQAAQKSPVNVEVAEMTGPVNGHASNGQWSFSQAQTAKEGALAELRQLELAERRRELIPVSYVRTWASRFLVEGRDLLLAGPGELQDVIAAESDPVKCERILRCWVERALLAFFSLERLWSEPHGDETALRERYSAAKLSLVKPQR